MGLQVGRLSERQEFSSLLPSCRQQVFDAGINVSFDKVNGQNPNVWISALFVLVRLSSGSDVEQFHSDFGRWVGQPRSIWF